MARIKQVQVIDPNKHTAKCTSQSTKRNIGFSKMNKHKRRSFKKYRGQGR